MSTFVLRSGVTVASDARARNLTFDEAMLHCELQDGRTISVPIGWYPALQSATPEQLNTWEIVGRGRGIHWPLLDEDLSVKGFMAGYETRPQQRQLSHVPLADINYVLLYAREATRPEALAPTPSRVTQSKLLEVVVATE